MKSRTSQSPLIIGRRIIILEVKSIDVICENILTYRFDCLNSLLNLCNTSMCTDELDSEVFLIVFLIDSCKNI